MNNHTVYITPPKYILAYFELSEKILAEKDVFKRIEYCNQQFVYLPAFVKSELDSCGSLPPLIACRDWAPKLYMRLGRWADAERAIQNAIRANAYYPDHGEKELAYLYNYRKVANITLEFLKENPGYLQKDIYKALNDQIEDISLLKNFTRWSMQIKKEPYKRTNKLYAISI